jgi:Asp-tRNA(Asn)/Glu-tRNA(Gln) amidotransferase A subunit family amidase
MIDRRTFLLAGVAVGLPRRSSFTISGAKAGARAFAAEPPRLETFSQWLNASPKTRELALQPLLERIRAADTSIHAWVQVQPEPPTGSGPLTGIPLGIKDVIETKGLATEYGSPIYKGRIGTADAAIVRELRQRGAIVLGKTHTTGFAYRTPGPTRNPRDLAHTPGGSSSGSAAAVAAGMVPLAVGTQTGGSVLRPASFCGVTGFKASYGLLSTEGVLLYSKSLDTLGFFTHTPADMLAFWQAIGRPSGSSEDVDLGAPEPMPPVEPEMAAAFQATVQRLKRAGARIKPIDIAPLLARLVAAQGTIATYEGARAHEQRFKEYGDRLDAVATMVRDGMKIAAAEYESARQVVAECRSQFNEYYKATPVILVPAATGPAPLGLASTGDSRMNAPWTALGTPAISIPMPVGDALPLGLQLTAQHGEDARVLRTAVRLAQLIGGRT